MAILGELKDSDNHSGKSHTKWQFKHSFILAIQWLFWSTENGKVFSHLMAAFVEWQLFGHPCYHSACSTTDETTTWATTRLHTMLGNTVASDNHPRPVNQCLQGFFSLTNTLVTSQCIRNHLHIHNTLKCPTNSDAWPLQPQLPFCNPVNFHLRVFVLSTNLVPKHDDWHTICLQWVWMVELTTV